MAHFQRRLRILLTRVFHCCQEPWRVPARMIFRRLIDLECCQRMWWCTANLRIVDRYLSFLESQLLAEEVLSVWVHRPSAVLLTVKADVPQANPKSILPPQWTSRRRCLCSILKQLPSPSWLASSVLCHNRQQSLMSILLRMAFCISSACSTCRLVGGIYPAPASPMCLCARHYKRRPCTYLNFELNWSWHCTSCMRPTVPSARRYGRCWPHFSTQVHFSETLRTPPEIEMRCQPIASLGRRSLFASNATPPVDHVPWCRPITEWCV